jgi:hypothetical protein
MNDIERTLLFGSNLPHLRCSFSEYSPSFLEKIFMTALPGWGVARIFTCRRSSDLNDYLSEFQNLSGQSGGEAPSHRRKRTKEAVLS